MHQVPRIVQLLTDGRVASVAAAPKPAFIINGSGELLVTNHAGLSLIGADTRAAAAAILAAVRGPLAAAARNASGTEGGTPSVRSLPFPIKGARRAVEFACSPITFDGGAAVLLVGTEPSAAEGPAPAAAASALLDAEEEPLAVFDRDGRRVHSNPAAAALLGAIEGLTEIAPSAHSVLAAAREQGTAELPFGVLRILLWRIDAEGLPGYLAAFIGPARNKETETDKMDESPTPEATTAAAVSSPQNVGAEVAQVTDTAAALPEPAAPAEATPEPSPEAAAAAETTPEPAPQPATGAAGDPAAPDAEQPSSSPNRFVWHTDAEGRFTSVSPELAAAVGEKTANLIGLHWTHAATRIGIQDAEAVREAMRQQDTWSGITVQWPISGSELVRPVELAALPVFDRERRFQGYRGFGVLRDPIPRAQPIFPEIPDEPAAREPAAPDAQPATEAEPPDAGKPAASEPSPPATAEPEGEPERTPPTVVETRENVVTLYKGPMASDHGPALTAGERNAFREIAKIIGSRLNRNDGDWPVTTATARLKEPPALSKPISETVRTPPAPPHTPDSSRVVLERLPIGVAVHRGESVVYANRALLEWIGLPSVEALADAGGLARMFSGTPALGVDEAGESGRAIAISGQHGEPIPVEARLLSAPWEGETALVYVLRRTDTGFEQRVEASERALREAEASARELRAILDTATDGIALLDPNGNVLGINRSAEALFGFEAADIEGRPFTELMAPESHRAALDYLHGLAENGVASVLNDGLEVIGRVKEGGLIPLFMTLGRVEENGQKFCAVLRDITQWKRAEEELVHAKREAERASSAKSEFLAKISHEIRTPLNAIIGFSEVMMEERFGPVGNDRYREYLKDIHASGEHLVSLINDLLDLSKIEAGKLDLAFASVDLNEIASQCMALMQPQANRERIIIRSALAQRLPPVVADARSVRQIVLNLLSNSIKFTQPGGQVIVSTTLTEESEVHLRVRDTGIGMSEAEITTALEPFRQITTTGRAKSGGTGLGLPLTKALVEANRASFVIKSSVNGGTLVEVAFPSTRVLAE